MLVTTEIGTTQLADLIKQVQAGDEVLLTQNSEPVAKIVSASQRPNYSGTLLNIRTLRGHKVLTPVISQADLADELFSRQ